MSERGPIGFKRPRKPGDTGKIFRWTDERVLELAARSKGFDAGHATSPLGRKCDALCRAGKLERRRGRFYATCPNQAVAPGHNGGGEQ
jgi:hypothetical protein